MGLFNWLAKRGIPKTIARTAYEAYLKYKKSDPELTEAEIANALFLQRCSPGNLNKAEKIRLEKYLETEEEIDSIYKLCLAILYIVADVSRDDVKAYSTARKILEEELTRSGYKIPSSDIRK